MKKNRPRTNEMCAVLNRNLLEAVPDGVDAHKWQQFRTEYNRAADLQPNDHPAQIDIELSSTCNMRCSFCIHSVKDIPRKVLPEETYRRIIDEAVRNGTRSLKLNYMNEPLLVKDLEQYILYAKQAGILNVFFATNGTLLTQKRARSLIESGLTKIFISIDAVREETYKKERNSTKFHVVVSNILGFLDVRRQLGVKYPLVRVNFLRNKINEAEEEDFINQWTPLVDMVAIQEMNEVVDHESGLFIQTDKPDYKCSFPFKQLVVTASGDILPCCTMHGLRMKLGNIKEMTLLEAWNSAPMKALRALHENGDYAKNPICRYCITGK